MNKQIASPEGWVGINEVAQHLGVSISWVRKAVHEYGLPVRHCGRSLRFKLSAIDAYMDGQDL